MALLTALEIVKRMADETGLSRPSALVASTIAQDRQLLALLNSAGKDLVREHEWSSLIALKTHSTVSGTYDYALPTDFHRMVSETQWDRTNKLPMRGPETRQGERWRRESGLATAGLRRVYSQIGAYVRVTPTPDVTGDTLIYEYVSEYWAASAAPDPVAKIEITADTDTTLFDPDLMVKELKWRFRAAKGLDATEAKIERDRALDILIAADLGGSTLNMGGPGAAEQGGEVIAGADPNFVLTEGGDFIASE